MDSVEERLGALIELVGESPRSDFYRLRWGGRRAFSDLPSIGPEDLSSTPLRGRAYTEGPELVKIIKRADAPFLMARGTDDVRAEPYGEACARPLVLMTDSHDALEKILWFYEHDILPLGGEIKNLPVAAHTAARYGIDALVTDTGMLARFLPELEKAYAVAKVASLTLIGERFSDADMEAFLPRFPRLRLLLGLSEAGAFAEACAEALNAETLRFHAEAGSVLELVEHEIVLTKLSLRPTPIIRYRTGIFAHSEKCACGKKAVALL